MKDDDIITSPPTFSNSWKLRPDTPSALARRAFKEVTGWGGGIESMLMRPKDESFSSNEVFDTTSPFLRQSDNVLTFGKLESRTIT
jgi:hypothetical protein